MATEEINAVAVPAETLAPLCLVPAKHSESRCDRRAGHRDGHSWELLEEIARLKWYAGEHKGIAPWS